MHHHAACEIKQKLGHRFPFQNDLRAVEVCCVQCPVEVCCVQSLYSCVPLTNWVTRTVYTRPVVQLVRSKKVKIRSSFFNHTVWLSNRTKIPLESDSSADKRFRTDLKIFNENCIIYVSQADVQSERRCVH